MQTIRCHFGRGIRKATPQPTTFAKFSINVDMIIYSRNINQTEIIDLISNRHCDTLKKKWIEYVAHFFFIKMISARKINAMLSTTQFTKEKKYRAQFIAFSLTYFANGNVHLARFFWFFLKSFFGIEEFFLNWFGDSFFLWDIKLNSFDWYLVLDIFSCVNWYILAENNDWFSSN